MGRETQVRDSDGHRPAVEDPPTPEWESRVLAVVVAYNSPKALARCLHSLDAQTLPVDVLVIDNSEPAPVELPHGDLAVLQRTRVVSAGSNLGPAGGFALGLAWFFEEGRHTHAWLMDDDTYPEPDVVEILLAKSRRVRRGSAVFPSVVNELTGESINYPSWCGVLVDRLAVQMAGLPKAELFWWAEDTEYLQFRLPRKGVIVTRAKGARVWDDKIRRVGGRPAWKYYYEVRNMIWFRVGVQRGTELWKLPRTLVGLLGSAVVSSGRAEKVRMYVKGLAHGVIGRLGREVRPLRPERPAEEDSGD